VYQAANNSSLGREESDLEDEENADEEGDEEKIRRQTAAEMTLELSRQE
jgi:hypothetical protein